METYSMVILGNGFDVALGIPTRYSQFYESSTDLRDYAMRGNALCQHILDNVKSELWSDLERGLYLYSKNITQYYGGGNAEQADKLKREFGELRKALFNYLNSVASKPVDANDDAPVIGLNCEWHVLHPQYLTFNYSINTAVTADMNRRYILNSDDSINEAHFIYQHGSIFNTKTCQNNESDEIVVGIDPISQKVEPAHSFLYKTHQHLHDLISTFEFIRNKRFYIVYGCSIGASDATYFKALFNHYQHDKFFLIYGFGPDAINSIRDNIAQLCDFNELIRTNRVEFLDIQQVAETRARTHSAIQSYLLSL